MRSTRRAVARLAARLGCEVSEDLFSGGGTIHVDAPRGTNLACDPGLHGLASSYYAGEKPEAWGELLSRLSYGAGVEPCEIEDCDVCRPGAGEEDRSDG